MSTSKNWRRILNSNPGQKFAKRNDLNLDIAVNTTNFTRQYKMGLDKVADIVFLEKIRKQLEEKNAN